MIIVLTDTNQYTCRSLIYSDDRTCRLYGAQGEFVARITWAEIVSVIAEGK